MPPSAHFPAHDGPSGAAASFPAKMPIGAPRLACSFPTGSSGGVGAGVAAWSFSRKAINRILVASSQTTPTWLVMLTSVCGFPRCRAIAICWSLGVRRIVEQHCQLDAAVPELREVFSIAVARIKIRRRIIRRKQNQRSQEFL